MNFGGYNSACNRHLLFFKTYPKPSSWKKNNFQDSWWNCYGVDGSIQDSPGQLERMPADVIGSHWLGLVPPHPTPCGLRPCPMCGLVGDLRVNKQICEWRVCVCGGLSQLPWSIMGDLLLGCLWEQGRESFPEKMLPVLAKVFISKAFYSSAGTICLLPWRMSLCIWFLPAQRRVIMYYDFLSFSWGVTDTTWGDKIQRLPYVLWNHVEY